MKKRKPQALTVMDAVDNLSLMAELDVPSMKERPLLEEEERVALDDPKYAIENQEKVKDTFRTLHKYLQNIYEKDKERLQQPETQRGIQAIMVLAGEAAQKVDKYTTLFKGVVSSVGELTEYQDLQNLYKNKISRKFTRVLDLEEAWEKEWTLEEIEIDKERRALKDLESVRSDLQYDLFYIRNEDGKPYFNRNLARHVKLVGDFDESIKDPEGENPLLRMKILTDKDAQIAAKEILFQASSYLDEFYKEAMQQRAREIVSNLNKALMALMLAANSRNLIGHTSGKTCLAYFTDFQRYLRQILHSSSYQKYLQTSFEKLEPFSHVVLYLVQMLTFFLFTRTPERKEMLELIKRLRSAGGEVQHPQGKGSPVSFWNQLLEEDEDIRAALRKYPNGPVVRTLEAFRDQEEKRGFDPLFLGNLPCALYSFSNELLHVSCLKIPSPTRQEIINRAEITEEFKNFLRSINSRMKRQRHLLINLQDRTSWREHARCMAIETLAKEEEFSKALSVVTLPKDTPFYNQIDVYRNLNEADLFIEQFKEQILGGEQCGFHFPLQFQGKKFLSFVDKALAMVHKVYFSSKNMLSRKNRLDFIEIFYNFLILKFIEELRPDSISFTDKDSIDAGAASACSFYTFLQLLGSKSNTIEDKGFLIWMIYSSALLIRERAIDPNRLHRFISASAIVQGEMEAEKKKILKAANALFESPLFDKLEITSVTAA